MEHIENKTCLVINSNEPKHLVNEFETDQDEKHNKINDLVTEQKNNTTNNGNEFDTDIIEEDEELKRMLLPDVKNLPLSPPSAVYSNFSIYFAPDFIKPGYDQYVYRHPNGLCVIGLASGHVVFKDEGEVTGVDFNVGKSDRSGIKVTGKRKRNAQHFEPNTALCKVSTKDATYIVRCCVKGSLLEVNDRLTKKPELLNTEADREGYIAIMMPRPSDWLKAKASLIGLDEYKKLREAI